MLLDGGTLAGAEAVAAGLAISLEEDPLMAAAETAERWAATDPQLTRDIKTAVQTAVRADFDTTLEFESWAQAASATNPAVQETVARFRGR